MAAQVVVLVVLVGGADAFLGEGEAALVREGAVEVGEDVLFRLQVEGVGEDALFRLQVVVDEDA